MRVLTYVNLLLLAGFILVSGVTAAEPVELNADYLYGRWVFNDQNCSSQQAEIIEFRDNGTFETGRAGKTEAVGFWEFDADGLLVLHMLTTPAHFKDINEALAAYDGIYQYFPMKIAVFNTQKNSLEAVSVLGEQVRKMKAFRCQ